MMNSIVYQDCMDFDKNRMAMNSNQCVSKWISFSVDGYFQHFTSTDIYCLTVGEVLLEK